MGNANGAIAIDLETRLSYLPSIFDFGGVADGATDNGPAFRKAFAWLAARGGGSLHIPGSALPFVVGQTTDPATVDGFHFVALIPSNVRIHGQGTIQLADGVNSAATLTGNYGVQLFGGVLGCSHVTVEGITVNMNGAHNLQPAASENHPQYAFRFSAVSSDANGNFASHVSFQNGVKIINNAGDNNIVFQGAAGSYASIIDCKFLIGGKGLQTRATVATSGTAVTWTAGAQFNAGMAGLYCQIAGVWYLISTYNSATSLTLSASAGTQTGAAFAVCANTHNVDFSFLYSEWSNTKINHNFIAQDPANTGPSGGLELHNIASEAIGNIIQNCYPGVWLQSSPGAISRVNVIGNTMTDCMSGIGLWAGDQFWGAVIIANNNITLKFNPTLFAVYGESFGIGQPYGGARATNTWTNATANGVILDGLSITGNTVSMNTSTPAANDGTIGITLCGARDVQILNNSFKYLTAIGVQLLGSTYGSARIHIEQNSFLDYGNNTTGNNTAAIWTDFRDGTGGATAFFGEVFRIRHNDMLRVAASAHPYYGFVSFWPTGQITNFVTENNRLQGLTTEMVGNWSVTDTAQTIVRHQALEATGSAIPTGGTWSAGDIVWHSAPTSAILGWYCTLGGTPGTWVAFGGGASGVTSLAGTANQVIVSASTGNVTLSGPQDLHTGATPTFASMALNAGGVYAINGQQVVGPRGATVSTVGGTAAGTYGAGEQTMLNGCAGAINAIITRLLAHGLIG